MNLRKIKRLKCLFKANKKYLMIKKKKNLEKLESK